MPDISKLTQKHLDQLEGICLWGYPFLGILTVTIYFRPNELEKLLNVNPSHASTVLWVITVATYLLLFRTLRCLSSLVNDQGTHSAIALEDLRTYPTFSNPFYEGIGSRPFESVFGISLLVFPAITIYFLGIDVFYRFTLPALNPVGSSLSANADGILLIFSFFVGQAALIIAAIIIFYMKREIDKMI